MLNDSHERMALMRQDGVRHLPVVDRDTVVGIISIRDLMADIIPEHEQTIEQLKSYIQR